MKNKRGILPKVLLLAVLTLNFNTYAETQISKLQKKAPKNWNKWGKSDVIGSLNYLTNDEVLRGVKEIKTGERFTLQIPMIHGDGPVFPGRIPAMHYMTQDEGSYMAKKLDPLSGGVKYSDDVVFMYLQGTSHVDGLGHAWYGEQVYNGRPAMSSIGGHEGTDVAALGERGMAGRGVLIDVGAVKGDKNGRLKNNECVSLADLKNVLKKQGTTVQKHDIVIIRTGSMGRYYDKNDRKNWDATKEPGLCYSSELVNWLNDKEVGMLAADNLAVEKAFQKIDGKMVGIPLHAALIRDMGLVLSELYWLDDLAKACAKDKRYSFFFVAAPLKMQGGTGAPVNPIVIR